MYNKANVRQMIARRLGRFEVVTASGGTTLTATSTSDLYHADDFWNGYTLYVQSDAAGTGAAPQGETRVVTDYDQATQTLTVGLAFTAAIAASDILEVHPSHYSITELGNLMSDAIMAAGNYWYQEVWDEHSLDAAAGTFRYSLPAGGCKLRGVYVRRGSNQRWVPYHHWEVKRMRGARFLVVSSDIGTGDLALHYEKSLAWTGNGDDAQLNIAIVCDDERNQYERMAVACIVEFVLEKLYLKLMNEGDDAHRNHYWNLARLSREERLRIQRDEAMPPLQGQVLYRGWQEHDYGMRDRAYTQLSSKGTAGRLAT